MSGCPSDEVLAGFLEGRVSGASGETIQAHLRTCTACVSLLAELMPRPVEETAPAPATAAAEAPKQIEEYQIERLLGQGAMGSVYLAHDTRLCRPVALKFLLALVPDATARARFLIEARAIARLDHPNVVAIYRVGEHGGRPYLASEYVRGQSLDRLPRPLPWEQALRIAVDLSRGLGAAHRRGVLHRDIKPANAMLTEEGRAKLLDFGLAKLGDGPEPSVEAGSTPPEAPGSTTLPGALLGTPVFLAPELWQGAPATRQADVYALGALIYDLCAGRPPHQAATLGELGRLVREQPAPRLLDVAPAVDTRLGDIVDRCLRRSPAERPASGDDLCQVLERLLEAPTPLAAPGDNPYRGLAPFEAEHRALFFGRRTEVRAVLDLLRSEPLVLVAGDSGVGKSSLCRAGVATRVVEGALEDGLDWSVLRLAPGRRPVLALAGGLARRLGRRPAEVHEQLARDPAALISLLMAHSGTGTLLLIDQLEELVTQAEPGEAQAAARMLGHLAARAHGVRLLLTARADFLTRLAVLPGLGPELSRAIYLLRPPMEEGLREAIVGPAAAGGYRFESEALVEQLVEAALRTEGALPLLQFALGELWEARDRERRLVLAEPLARLGGIEGALARHADGVLESLLPAQRRTAQHVLTQLLSAEGANLRRTLSDLGLKGDDEARALEALVHGRLVTAGSHEDGAACYEIAHEALFRGWDTLRRWREADRLLLARRDDLDAAAQAWQAAGCPGTGLPAGALLGHYAGVGIEDQGRYEALCGPAARRFLTEAQAQQARAEEDRRRVAQERLRRQRRAIGALSSGVVVLLGLLAIALQQRHIAERRRQDAMAVAGQIVEVIDGRLEGIAGTAAVRDELLAAGHQLVERLGAGDASDPALLLRRAQSYLALSQAAEERGDVQEALAQADRGLVLAREVIRLDRRSANHRATYSGALEIRGELLLERLGRPAEAEESLRASLTELEGLMVEHPGDEPWPGRLSIAHSKLAAAQAAGGSSEAAESTYRAAREEAQRALARRAADGYLLLGLSRAELGLARLALERGDLAAARVAAEEARQTTEQRVRKAPNNRRSRHQLAQLHHLLQRVARAEGQIDRARQEGEVAVRLFETLVAAEPQRPGEHGGLLLAVRSLAEIERSAGRADRAQALLLSPLPRLEAFVQSSPRAQFHRGQLAAHLLALGETAFELGQPGEARARLHRAQALLEELRAAEPANQDHERTRTQLAAALLRVDRPGPGGAPQRLPSEKSQ